MKLSLTVVLLVASITLLNCVEGKKPKKQLAQCSRCAEKCSSCSPQVRCPCRAGQFRTTTGQCVARSQCNSNIRSKRQTDDVECPPNESRPACTRPNEDCKDKNNLTTTRICIQNEDRKCTCVDGFFRNTDNVCVRRDECDVQ